MSALSGCRNGGAVGRLPVPTPTAAAAPAFAAPQWRGSRETARSGQPSGLGISRTMPQWRGSRETARSSIPTIPRLPRTAPQWRGSRETARSRSRAKHGMGPIRRNGGAVGRLPVRQREGHPHRRGGCRNGGAVGRLPVPPGQLGPRPLGPCRNGGAVGRLPVRARILDHPDKPRWPQWRGSRETARSSTIVNTLFLFCRPQWRGSRETARST